MKNMVKLSVKLFVAIAVIGIFASTAFAALVSVDTAQKVAVNWMNEKTGKAFKVGDVSVLNGNQRDSVTPYYILKFKTKGWVIVSGDDVAYPVIAYSDASAYSDTSLPPAFEEWMGSVKQQITSARSKALRSSDNPPAKAAWDRLNVATETFVPQKSKRDGAVGPLLQTTWNQDEFYNEFCPADSSAPWYAGGHAFAGCVATAMAQVMKYHNYPTQGTGSHSYTHPKYGTLYADFGATTYNWASMPNSIESSNRNVATLLYHCGVSVEMDYGPDGSGANVSYYAKNALINYFKYDSSLYYAAKADYAASAWIDMLKTELNAARPIIYVGRGTGGHAFVCDGYKDADYFHFNWGWGGYLDGFFYLNDLTPDSHVYTNEQGGLMGVKPAFAPPPKPPVPPAPQPEPIYCTYTLSPESASFPAAGGTGNITVNVESGCSGTTVSYASWIVIVSSPNGGGSGTVTYSVEANPTTNSRSGNIAIGDKTFLISQAAGSEPPPVPTCTYAISPEFSNIPTSGGNGSINVTAPAGCRWNAISNNPDWIMILGSSGTGNGLVMYSVSPNTSFMPRTGTISIGDKTFTITQGAVSCYQVISGLSISVLKCGGVIKIVIQIAVISYGTDCPPLQIVINDGWLTLGSEESAQRDGTTIIRYLNVAPNPDSTPRTTTIYVAGQPVTITQEGTETPYSEGVFTVDESGIVKIDWLYDGGKYQGEFGIFNLAGMDSLTPGSSEFIAEAVKRVLSNSDQGYLVFSDLSEGARFSGLLGNEIKDWNAGSYKGVKSFAIPAGTHFATILVPNSTFQSLSQNPATTDANKRPLFSLVSENPAYGMYLGQMADINGMGKAYAYEDKDAATSDWDFNDLIVQITGAQSNIPTINSLNTSRSSGMQKRDGFADWRTGSELGRLIMSHIEAPAVSEDTLRMSVTLNASATLLVYDPSGKFIGKEGGTIAGADFSLNADGSQTVTLNSLNPGSYRIIVQSAVAAQGTLAVKTYQGSAEISSGSVAVSLAAHETMTLTVPASSVSASQSLTLGTPVTATSYDFSGDGVIDNGDVALVVRHWNSCRNQQKYDPFFDLNDDGCITVADVMKVLNAKTVK